MVPDFIPKLVENIRSKDLEKIDDITKIIEENPYLLMEPVRCGAVVMPLYHFIAFCGDAEVFQFASGFSQVSFDCLSQNNETPLMLAAYNGQRKIVQFLLENDATVDLVGRLGFTFRYAIYGADLEVFKMVVQRYQVAFNSIDSLKVFLNKTYSDGKNILHYIAMANFNRDRNDTAMARLAQFVLENAGSDMLLGYDSQGCSPLFYALLKMNNPLMQLFLKSGSPGAVTETEKRLLLESGVSEDDFESALEEVLMYDDYLEAEGKME